ncbi:MAG: hypothetical protein AAFZ18_27485 [Myxococcota bacterium]
MKRTFFVAAVTLAAGACADRNVGQPIPADQFYFPSAVTTVGDPSAGRIAVLSSNFDQRFQSQQITLLNAGALIDLALSEIGGGSGDGACDVVRRTNRPFYTEDLSIGLLGGVKIPGVGGELLAVEEGTSGAFDLYATNRLNSALIRAHLPANSNTPRCARMDQLQDEDLLIPNTDCSENFVIVSGAEDPFSLTRGVDPMGNGYIAVGHVFGYSTGFSQFGVVTFLDEQRIKDKQGSQFDVGEDEEDTFTADVASFAVDGAAGLAGLAFSELREELLITSLRLSPRMELVGVELILPGEAADEGADFVPSRAQTVAFEAFTNAVGSRGVALTPDGQRAVVSLRFAQAGSVTDNAGLAIVNLAGEDYEPFPALEVGEELGPPALRPQGPGEPLLAYFGDLLTDKVFIVDVTRNSPRVVGELNGRAFRDIPGRDEPIFAHILDGPTSIAFVTHNGRPYGFVANFANSTLSLIDAGAAQPQQHCVLARFGRDVDANNETEEEKQQ